MSIYQAFVKAASVTYVPDGVDNINKTINGSAREYKVSYTKRYRTSAVTVLSSFLGLPNRMRNKMRDDEADLTWKDIGKNVIGYPDDGLLREKILYGILVTPINLITLPFKLIGNLLKTVTELLPLTLAHYFELLSEQLRRNTTNKFGNSETLKGAGGILLKLLSLVMMNIYYLGRATTSPITSARAAWKYGRDFGGTVGTIAGSMLAAISLFYTLTLYSILFPLTIKLMATVVAPYLAHHLPIAILHAAAAIGKVGTPIFSTLQATMSPVLAAIGNCVAPVAKIVMRAVSFGAVSVSSMASLSTAAMGLGAVAALFMVTIMNGIDKLVTQFEHWWNRRPSLYAQITNPLLAERDVISRSFVPRNTTDMKRTLSHAELSTLPGMAPGVPRVTTILRSSSAANMLRQSSSTIFTHGLPEERGANPPINEASTPSAQNRKSNSK